MGPVSVTFPATSCDPHSWEFVLQFQIRLQQARDTGQLAQVQMLPGLHHCRDPFVQFKVGCNMWLDTLECPVQGEKYFCSQWAGQFKIVVVSGHCLHCYVGIARAFVPSV